MASDDSHAGTPAEALGTAVPAALYAILSSGAVGINVLAALAMWFVFGCTVRSRLVIGLLGPRGTASIVFGLLAYNALEGTIADDTLYVMTISVYRSACGGTGNSPRSPRAPESLRPAIGPR